MNLEILFTNILAEFTGWCNEVKVRQVFGIIKEILNIVRFIVPIALIAMTSMDIIKKVINPDDKEGQKKIMYRAIGALIVFFIPTIISILFWIIDVANGKTGTEAQMNSGISACWK